MKPSPFRQLFLLPSPRCPSMPTPLAGTVQWLSAPTGAHPIIQIFVTHSKKSVADNFLYIVLISLKLLSFASSISICDQTQWISRSLSSLICFFYVRLNASMRYSTLLGYHRKYSSSFAKRNLQNKW